MHFKLTNTLSRTKEELQPISAPEVLIYTCGPTVYNFAHIGNLRTYIIEDLLVRALRVTGFSPRRVMNITDVGHLTSDEDEGEDKLEVGAAREGLSAWDIALKYEEAFLNDMRTLLLEVPEHIVRATDTIPEQIEFIKELEAKGYTYTTSDGVYFDSSKVENYGALAHINPEGLQEGIRVETGEKRNKTDFALWKFSGEPGKRHMEWESPWGLGFPGWHIECSAIIRKSLGDTIDIHCGGADHIMVHHPNEMAQSETVTGKPLSRIWFHAEFLLIDGGKMSKSLENIYTLADIKERGFDPLAFKLFTLSAGYRSKLNFTWDGLAAAAQSLEKLRNVYKGEGADSEAVRGFIERFNEALSDDLNTPVALSVIWEAIGALPENEVKAFLDHTEKVFALGLNQRPELVIPEEVERLLEERKEARQSGDWDRSDALRNRIADLGFEVKDTPAGQEISKKHY